MTNLQTVRTFGCDVLVDDPRLQFQYAGRAHVVHPLRWEPSDGLSASFRRTYSSGWFRSNGWMVLD